VCLRVVGFGVLGIGVLGLTRSNFLNNRNGDETRLPVIY
jgi:hypothetical protein